MVDPEFEHPMHEEQDVVHVLWTGGWDSTYRVLVLLGQGRKVQPHYLIDNGRLSTELELKAMESIRACIPVHRSLAKGELLPTRISDKPTAVANNRIYAAYNEILKEFYVGEQYMWLAEYCERQGISNMEIGVENNPVVLEAVESTGYPYSEIFGRFEFPILSIDKLTMKNWAQGRGLLSVLEQTWFCHRPSRSGRPCGVCHPCEVSIKGGMGYRLSLKARVRYWLRITPRLKAFLKQFPRFYHTLYSLKHNR